MSQKARLKLTAWYLIIIMTISLSFSSFIYKSVADEFSRRLNSIERRLELGSFGFRPIPLGQLEFLIEDLEESKRRVFLLLLYTNGIIFIASAFAGYFLAGRTLKPIEDSLEEQKRFIADASHELKTPLTSLYTSIEVTLRDKKLNLKLAKQTLTDNLAEIKTLTKLANNLLTLTKYQTKSNGYRFEKFNLKEIISQNINKFKPLANKKNLQIIPKLKNVSIKADKDSIEKLTAIFLDNAIKYSTAKGKIEISLSKKQNIIYLVFSDNGLGIPKKDLPYIFDRFYRSDLSRSKVQTDGFGLGLSLAKEIVDLHKGKIVTTSKLGKGTKFTITIPQ